MASSLAARPALLPQCPSCVRRVMAGAWSPLQQTRSISKAAKATERNVTVKLLADVPRFGRAGSYVPLNRSMMRNRWFPARIADYVPMTQLKKLKAEGVEIARDFTYGVPQNLEEFEEEAEQALQQRKHYVRPIELEMLSVRLAILSLFTARKLTQTGRPFHGAHRHLRPAHD